MQPYRIKPAFYIIFTLVLLAPATWAASLLQSLLGNLPPGFLADMAKQGVVETPSAVIVIGFCFWLYERMLWKKFPLTHLHDVPNINGRYEGTVRSAYDNKDYPVAVEIRQTLTTVHVCLYSERSSSFSMIANVGSDELGNPVLAYTYRNKPRTVSLDLDMHMHDGFATLQVKDGGKKLEGFYFNDNRERQTHGVLACRLVSDKLLGSFKGAEPDGGA